ncbi:hypothetical protein [Adlercreutzia muris]|uniref:Uncharacterized protein n=1 Tax=Adlercreutzia muris TaxID=1796610 RepID=A0A7C8FNW0_9ACTN|nr:hypothetical protein [Adlercreutzia muris]KAB1647975.1 hypothetical protein F8D48_06695 [Adlercreutzia muris]MCR2027733.1 hypothetical protein [Adlercreutzia muris]
MAVGDFEGMTIEELCAWANGLCVCRFGIVEEFGEPRVKVSSENVHIAMSFGRFSESVSIVGGFRMVQFGALDNREGNYHGCGCGIAYLDELERKIALWADLLELRDDQLRLF